MEKLLTKKNVLFFGLGGIVTLALFGLAMSMDACYQNKICHEFFRSSLTRTFIFALFPVLTLLPISLITYKMHDEIFVAWISFVKWWIPLSVLAILLTPMDDEGSFAISLKGPLAVFCSIALFVISLIIITYKHFALKKSGAGK
jgi:predicted ABC-type exoprotein transport system permease subunit